MIWFDVFIGAWFGCLSVMVAVKSASFWRRHKKTRPTPMNVVNTCRHCSQEIREIGNGGWWSGTQRIGRAPLLQNCCPVKGSLYTKLHAPLPPTAEVTRDLVRVFFE